MFGIIDRLRIEFNDALRFGTLPKFLSSTALLVVNQLKFPHSQLAILRYVESLCRGARIATNASIRSRLEVAISRLIEELDLNDLPWDDIFPDSVKPTLEKAIILKKPQDKGEKGVLLISFENQWLRLLRHANLKTLANDYDLVLAPSWSPPHDLSFYLASKFWPGTLFHLISNHSDVVTSKRIYKNSHAIPLLASNWVHPDIFKPRAGIQKEFDIVTLANFSKYKRHFSLFRLLRHMRSDTRVLLLGVPWQDRTAETLKAEASLYGVSHRITIREHLPDNQLLESIQSAKVGFIPSMNEGSCVAVTEMLFLDVPVGLYKAAIVGSKQFIGAGTGIIIGYRDAGELQRFVDEYRSYSPRQIVTQNRISCFDSTVVLNERLKRSATENGTPWTTDICVHHWRPNPTYVSNSDMARFEPEIHDFKKKYGIEIKSPHSIKPIA